MPVTTRHVSCGRNLTKRPIRFVIRAGRAATGNRRAETGHVFRTRRHDCVQHAPAALPGAGLRVACHIVHGTGLSGARQRSRAALRMIPGITSPQGGRPSKPKSGSGLVSGALVAEDPLDDGGVLGRAGSEVPG
jgi:hypothetical protein